MATQRHVPDAPDHGPDRGGAEVEPHRGERPEEWGWHAEAGRWARIGGWLSVVLLLLLNFTTHYNNAQDVWIYGSIGVIVLMLVRDYYRRKNAWRS